jgi:translation initiation factor IF-2
MDVVNLSRSRRFLRERPMRVNLFDRPRLATDLLCLESGQTEALKGVDTSDSLYLVLEGQAHLRSGAQSEDLQEMDAVLVPPGVETMLQNTGAGRLVVMLTVTPKPTRASEVRVPGEEEPRRPFRAADRGIEAGERDRPPRPPFRRAGDTPGPRAPRRGPAPAGRTPARGRPEVSTRRPVRSRDEGEGPAWYPREKAAWSPRGGRPAGNARAAGPGPRGERAAPRPGGRPYPGGRAAPGGRGPGGRSTGGGQSRGGGVYFKDTRDEGNEGERPQRPLPRAAADAPSERRPPRTGAGGQARGRSNAGGAKKTGDARRASRGQGPLSGRRGPARSGPRTSGPRRSP